MGERMLPVLFGSDARRLERLDCPREVPWSLLAPHEEWAIKNHSQTLETLASRGGLDPREMVLMLDHREWRGEELRDLAGAVERIKAPPATPPGLNPSGQEGGR
jgi:hypothetical protein